MRKPKVQRKRKGNSPNFYKKISSEERDQVEHFFKAQLREALLRIHDAVIKELEEKLKELPCQP